MRKFSYITRAVVSRQSLIPPISMSIQWVFTLVLSLMYSSMWLNCHDGAEECDKFYCFTLFSLENVSVHFMINTNNGLKSLKNAFNVMMLSVIQPFQRPHLHDELKFIIKAALNSWPFIFFSISQHCIRQLCQNNLYAQHKMSHPHSQKRSFFYFNENFVLIGHGKSLSVCVFVHKSIKKKKNR